MRRRILSSCELLFLWSILALPCLAQTQITPAPKSPQQADQAANASYPDDSEDNTTEPSYLNLNLHFEPGGNFRVAAGLYFTQEANPAEFRSALEAALGCTLIPSQKAVTNSSNSFWGDCASAPKKSGLMRQGKISTIPLKEFCEAHNIQSLSINFNFPPADIIETIPPAQQLLSEKVLLVNKNARQFNKWLARSPGYTWRLDTNIPREIQYRFGFESATLSHGSLYLALALFAPLVLCFWLGRKALSARTDDKAVVWFSYMRYLQWMLNGCLIAWWAAIEESHLRDVLSFLAEGTRYASLWKHPVTYEVVSWIPPGLVWLLCLQFSHPVQQKLRGLTWTNAELRLQSLYSVIKGLLPFALFLTGLRVMGTGSFRTGLLWMVAAIVVGTYASNALLKLTGMQAQALTSGELRDRAFSMAERLGVKLEQVFLIPSGKGQMANAFARNGNTISFTDFLLQRMSTREIEYVLGHELTHLKLKHPAKLGYAYLGGYFLSITLVGFLPSFIGAHLLLRYGVILAGVTAFPYFFSRRFEYAADAGAVGLTADPRAAISALFKLSELNMMPTHWSHWSEKWLTHPSSLRRAQAIAKKAGIPFEEIPIIVRDSANEAPSHSPLSLSKATKLHSSHFKSKVVKKLSWILLAILTFVPTLLSLAALHVPFHALQLALFALAVPATFGAVLLLSNYIPRLTRGNIAAVLDQKLLEQGVDAKALSGIYVGFSPSAAPRSYESNSYWDIGYLFLRSDRICFWGEEQQFALRRDQITAIKLDYGLPGYLRNKRVYIAWQDAERGTCGVFNLGRGHADSVVAGAEQTAQLASRLRLWWQNPSPARPVPQPLDTLASPEVRAVTASVPGAIWKPGKLLAELAATGFIAGLGAALCGLPFHIWAFLFRAGYERLGIHNISSTPGAGWFVVATAMLVRFLSLIPAMRYKDKPVLMAQAPSASTSQTRLASTTRSETPVGLLKV